MRWSRSFSRWALGGRPSSQGVFQRRRRAIQHRTTGVGDHNRGAAPSGAGDHGCQLPAATATGGRLDGAQRSNMVQGTATRSNAQRARAIERSRAPTTRRSPIGGECHPLGRLSKPVFPEQKKSRESMMGTGTTAARRIASFERPDRKPEDRGGLCSSWAAKAALAGVMRSFFQCLDRLGRGLASRRRVLRNSSRAPGQFVEARRETDERLRRTFASFEDFRPSGEAGRPMAASAVRGSSTKRRGTRTCSAYAGGSGLDADDGEPGPVQEKRSGECGTSQFPAAS